MNKWDEYINYLDELTECRTCGTETNGDTYCSRSCYNYDVE
jgi:hypothetical protein